MSRLLIILGLVLLGIVGMAAVLGYFAYGNEATRSGRLVLDGLQQPAAIQWSEDGSVTVEATGEADLFAALGYVHGADHAWAMTLWRQAALGQLSKWFGPDYVGYDRHARMLGFGALAEETYEAISEEEKALLDAYARGTNLALASTAVTQQDEFVLLDLKPEAWLPWHSLAVERMMAWMGTPGIAAIESIAASFAAPAHTDSALVRFAAADSLFRGFLHLGGADQSRAWTARIGATTIAVHQLAYGNSALPMLREVTLRVGSAGTLVATVPGTLMLPAGQSETRAWSVFLTSDLTLAPTDSLPPPPLFDRLVDRTGSETLLTFPRSPDGLYFKAEPLAPTPTAVLASVDSLGEAAIVRDSPLADSLRLALRDRPGALSLKTPPAWLVRWRGFAPGTDLGAWRMLLNGSQPPPFTLFRGDGLLASSDGSATALGSPPVQRTVPGGLFVAADAAIHFAADRLDMLLGSTDATANPLEPPDPNALVMDAFSPWAASITPRLIEQLGHRDSLDASIKDAYAFLHGWDYRYDRGSIAASLFETWMTEYRNKTGRLPTTVPDSTMIVILHQTLRDAVEHLKSRHTERASAWRWELIQPGARFFPVWSDTSRGPPPSRYAPLTPGLGGHPTTLRPGPSLVFGGTPAPAVWTAWTITSNWNRTHIYHPVTRRMGFLPGGRRRGEPAPSYAVQRDAEMSSPLFLHPSRSLSDSG
ncbi:MAG: penicillin acylase family protein [Bacteroidetes bacterium]|nr:penicillin acylase family protein [Bacteroidota bacterium]